jgi:hypothetical protein
MTLVDIALTSSTLPLITSCCRTVSATCAWHQACRDMHAPVMHAQSAIPQQACKPTPYLVFGQNGERSLRVHMHVCCPGAQHIQGTSAWVYDTVCATLLSQKEQLTVVLLVHQLQVLLQIPPCRVPAFL